MTAPAIVVPGLEWRFRLALALMLVALIAPAVEPRIVAVTAWPVAGLDGGDGSDRGWASGLVCRD